MTTISAKELRINLSEYLKRARDGEEIEVIYRSKPAVKLQSATKKSGSNAEAVVAAIRQYNSKVKSVPSQFSNDTPIKDLYHDLSDHDEKYKGHNA